MKPKVTHPASDRPRVRLQGLRFSSPGYPASAAPVLALEPEECKRHGPYKGTPFFLFFLLNILFYCFLLLTKHRIIIQIKIEYKHCKFLFTRIPG